MDLVLSVGANYAPAVFERFLGSLRHTGYAGDVVIAVPRADDRSEIRVVCERHGAVLLAYPDTSVIPVCARFLVFSSVLKECGERYGQGRVLHTDLRDIIFQLDPFKFNFPPGHNIFFALEDGKISESSFNCEWLRDGFGTEIVSKLADRPIVCCGTTIGSFSAMNEYFARMCTYIFGEPLTPPITAKRNDQGVHNYLIYSGGFDDLKPLTLGNIDGLFLTLGLMKDKQVSASGQILCANGAIPCVAHQVDRLSSTALAELSANIPWPLLDLTEMAVTREVLEANK